MGAPSDLAGSRIDAHGTGAAAWPDWSARQQFVAQWLREAPRGAVETFAAQQFDRAERAWCLARQTAEHEERRAQREASHAVAGALDWTAAASRPSHAELVHRRAVHQ